MPCGSPPDAAARDLGLHARFHRPGRGRADASADRAPGSLRAMPHLSLWRPCDAAETAVAWTLAIERARTHGADSHPPGAAAAAAHPGAARRRSAAAATCSSSPAARPSAIVIATGSEIGIAAQAVNALNGAGRRVRLVSMPCTQTFDAQEARLPGQRAASGAVATPWRSRRARPSPGGATSASMGGCSASIASAPPVRLPMCSHILASLPIISDG